MLLGVMDGLSGIEDAFTENLKTIYEAPSREKSLIILDDFCAKWFRIYPKVVSDWNDSIDTLLTFYNPLMQLRK